MYYFTFDVQRDAVKICVFLSPWIELHIVPMVQLSVITVEVIWKDNEKYLKLPAIKNVAKLHDNAPIPILKRQKKWDSGLNAVGNSPM